MSYNKYNTRHSGRFNSPGQFVSGGFAGAGHDGRHGNGPRGPRRHPADDYSNSYPQQQQQQQYEQEQEFQQQDQLPPPPPPQPDEESADVQMKTEPEGDQSDSPDRRPPWMRNQKFGGIKKKISNHERRQRQNKSLRRLLTPKNALMVLNEMVPPEEVNSAFKVEPMGAYPPQASSFCADLTLEGHTYKGIGENKMVARIAAAEQAVRDIVIKKLAGQLQAGEESGAAGGGGDGGAGGAAGEVEALPMIQLASYALHKLFAEWECGGHKVPPLRPGSGSPSVSEGGEGGAAPPRPAQPAAPRPLPLNAAQMHPCMLLTYMRPQLEWRALAAEGDRPQNMLYTMGVHADNQTFIGKGSNKKEARRLAARAACEALFGVQFEPSATVSVPVTK